MMQRTELAAYLDTLLDAPSFSDYAPNGLQVEGRSTIGRLVVGVSANQALIDAAVAHEADAVLVHHGFFWRNEPRTLTGLRARRVGSLMRHEISLFGYHLPLDAHELFGNNVGVLRALGATPNARFGGAPALGWLGTLETPLRADAIVDAVTAAVGQAPVAFLHGSAVVERIAVVTGGGAGFFEEALDAGAELFITGEPSEQSQGLAEELGAHFVAAGHHATERFGPRALGEHIAERFGIDVAFIDVPNPV